MKTVMLAFVAACLVLAGCVSQPSRIEATPSGNPEVLIATNDVSKIKSVILNHAINQGFAIERNDEFSLVLTKPATGMAAFSVAMAAGNAYSSNSLVLTYTFVKVSDGVRVVLSLIGRAQMPGGQTNVTSGAMNNVDFNAFQTGLYDLKRRVEAGT